MGCFYLTVYFVTCPLKKKPKNKKTVPYVPTKDGYTALPPISLGGQIKLHLEANQKT